MQLFNLRLTKAQIEELDRVHRKQLSKLWNDPLKKNRYVYRDSMEIHSALK